MACVQAHVHNVESGGVNKGTNGGGEGAQLSPFYELSIQQSSQQKIKMHAQSKAT